MDGAGCKYPVTYEGNEGHNQRWNFAAANGGLYVISRSSGLVLTIAHDENLIGSRVIQDTPDARQGQRWLLIP
ncbi:RICIN domain-containing protein [Ensifer adhaerens]|uniref:RICIN domain-containing protein n=1 Tax=Ensifer TaxID=106591 RepID=UPI000DD594D2